MSGYGFTQIYQELSAQTVLQAVQESTLWRYYLGYDYELKKDYISPLRPKESRPSFNLFIDKRNRVMFKDFGGVGLYGDIFEFLQVRDGLNYHEALTRINVDFRLRLGNPHEQSYNGYKPIGIRVQKQLDKFDEDFSIQTAPLMQGIRRAWIEEDFKYWMQYGITEATLKAYNVHCIKRVMVNGVTVYTQTPNNPCYGYYFPASKHIKFYFPFAVGKQPRFLGNANNYQDIQGYYQCNVKKDKKNQLLILTKSMKDCMCLRELGYEAMSIHGEGQFFYKDFIRHIKKYYPRIISLYDKDKTGMKGARYLWKEHRISPFFIPKSFTSAKDISDVYRLYGRERAEDLMKRIVSDVSH